MNKWQILKGKRDAKLQEKAAILQEMDRLTRLVKHAKVGLALMKVFHFWDFKREERRIKNMAVMTAVRTYCRWQRVIKKNGQTLHERNRRLVMDATSFMGQFKSASLLPQANTIVREFLRNAAVALEKKSKMMGYIGKVMRL